MPTTYIDIRFEGDKFSPKKLKKLTQLPIEILAEYGEIAKIGRYKNKPTPYGLALLKIEKNGKKDLRTNLHNSIKSLLSEKKALKQSGVEDIIVDIETSPNIEEGFVFDEDILTNIYQLKAKIEFNTIKDSKSYFNSIIEKVLNEHFLDKRLSSQINYLITSNKLKLTPDIYYRYNLSQSSLSSYLIIYFLKYSNEKKDKIPSFEEVLKKETNTN